MRNSQDILNSYSRELELLYCLSNDTAQIPEFEKQSINWEHFYTLATRHRLTPYIIRNLEKSKSIIPSYMLEKLIEKNRNNTKRMLQFSAEIIQLAKIFTENKIDYAFFKGPVLSYELYNDIGIRHSGDIDLIIEQSNISKANSLLSQLGYIRHEPGFNLTKKQEKANFSISHHYTYKHKERNAPIELHWNLTNPGSLFPITTQELLNKRREISFQNNKVFTISKSDKLLFLAVHGSIHRWYRLFWLKDFAEVSKTITHNEWTKLITHAKKWKIHKPIIQACVLANVIFGTDIPDIIKKQKQIPKFIRASLIAIGKNESWNQSRGLKKINYILYRIKIRKHFKYHLDLLIRLRTHYTDWEKLKLPDSLFFLYYFLRPFLWMFSLKNKS